MRGSAEAALVALFVAGYAGGEVAAQVRASERGSVSQTIDGAVLTINYARPRARGRSPLFGKVVTWGEVWTPGANWATTLDLSREMRLDGHLVPKGKYSVWFLVEPRQWTVILDPRTQRYHTEPPDSIAGQIRWLVHPTAAPATEVLTWAFPGIRPGAGMMRMEWGTTRVSIDVTVPPRHPLTVARDQVEPYLGRYRISMDLTGPDSVYAGGEVIELFYESGSLMARYHPKPAWYPSLQNSIMVWINDDWFIPTIVRNGEILEMVADMIFEFTLENGTAGSFEIRDDHDEILGRGQRIADPK